MVNGSVTTVNASLQQPIVMVVMSVVTIPTNVFVVSKICSIAFLQLCFFSFCVSFKAGHLSLCEYKKKKIIQDA